MRGKAFILALSLAGPASVSAQWVVSDPASYTYYVEQLRQMTAQLQAAKDTLDSMQKVQRDLTGMYNRARGLVNDIKKAEEDYRQAPRALKRVGDALGIDLDIGGGTAAGGFADIEKVIDKTFEDLRTRASSGFGGNGSGTGARASGADARHELQQQALKGVIGESEKLLGGISERLGTIKDLAGQVDSTANIKDAQDLNNRIALEILRTLTELLAVAAKSNQAQALFNYSGTTDAGARERQSILNDAARQMQDVEKVWTTAARTKGRIGDAARQLKW